MGLRGRKWGQGGDPARGPRAPGEGEETAGCPLRRVHTVQCMISRPTDAPQSLSSDPLDTACLCRPPESRQRDGGVAITVCWGGGGCWGRTKQTEMWSARLERRPVGAAAAGCVGRAGLGMGWEAQFWVIAPEILPSGCRRESGGCPLTSPGWNGRGRQPPKPPTPPGTGLPRAE